MATYRGDKIQIAYNKISQRWEQVFEEDEVDLSETITCYWDKASQKYITIPEPGDDTIPQIVIEGLAEVRASGLTNMFDRGTVIEILEMWGEDEAAEWLKANKPRYMDALNAMGAYVSKNK